MAYALAESYTAGVGALVGLGKGLAFLRNERRLTLEALAEKAEVRVSTLSDWENDHVRPQTRALEKVLDVLGADLFDLGAAIRAHRGEVAMMPARPPDASSLRMARKALPRASPETQEQWARWWELELEAGDQMRALEEGGKAASSAT